MTALPPRVSADSFPSSPRRRVMSRMAAMTVPVAGLAVALAPVAHVPTATAPTPVAAAATTSLAAASVSVPASLDTYVVAERSTLSYGTETKLTAANWSTWHSESYVRFALPADAQSRPVVSARVEFAAQRLDEQPAKAELHALTGAWSESTTYATRPTVGATVASFTLPGQGTTNYSFDVTGTVRAAGTYDFALTNPSAESVTSVFSREYGTSGPRLVVEYGAGALCGASFEAESGETYQQALTREDGYFNGLETVRVFYSGLPQSWPGKLNTSGRPTIISFKATPRDVLAGTHDSYLRNWFATAPTDQDIYWTFYHEPEDNIAAGNFTAADYRAAWQRLSGLADQAANPRLRATLILMGWTLNPASGRTWTDYYPGKAYLDVIAWDQYNSGHRNGNYNSAADTFGKIIEISRGSGLPWGIAETGTPLVAGDTGAGRAAWLREVWTYLSTNGAVFVAYFDLDWTAEAGIDYRLRDTPSKNVWAEFCS